MTPIRLPKRPPIRTPRLASLALAALSLAIALCACAEEASAAPAAAYPQQPIGYTIPPSSPPDSPASATAPRPPEPMPTAPPPGQEIAIGEDDPNPPPAQPDQYEDTDPSALTDFHAALDPYGNWVDDPTYGTVWVPEASAVGPDFTPYVSAGHWSYDDDYTWVSDYGWGWAPFHYGRWVWAAGPGWEWVPGRAYAGAWVSWRYGWGDWPYVGWAPLGPTWGWRGGCAVGLGFVPRAPYAFVRTGDLSPARWRSGRPRRASGRHCGAYGDIHTGIAERERASRRHADRRRPGSLDAQHFTGPNPPRCGRQSGRRAGARVRAA